jgi:hypothetical protein
VLESFAKSLLEYYGHSNKSVIWAISKKNHARLSHLLNDSNFLIVDWVAQSKLVEMKEVNYLVSQCGSATVLEVYTKKYD